MHNVVEPKSLSPIEASMSRLKKANEELANSLALLTSKLNPILNEVNDPYPEITTTEAVVEKLADRINEESRNVSTAAEAIILLSNRLEL